MDENITPSKRAIALIAVIGVIIGFSFLFYNFYLKELTWKQIVNNFVNEVRLGHSYYDGDRASELIFLLQESGFQTYDVNAFKLKGFCIIEGNINQMTDLAEKVFDNCIEPVQYIKLIAYDGNYFINAVTGEYAPMPLARGERKAIVVKNE